MVSLQLIPLSPNRPSQSTTIKNPINIATSLTRPYFGRRLVVKPQPYNHNMSTQHIATLLGGTCCVPLATMLRHVGCCWLKFEDGQILDNNTQHVMTHHNMAAKTRATCCTQQCCDMLQLLGQGFKLNAQALQFTVTTQLLPCNLCVFKACKEHSSIKTEVNQSFLVSVCYAMTTIHTFSLTFTMHFK